MTAPGGNQPTPTITDTWAPHPTTLIHAIDALNCICHSVDQHSPYSEETLLALRNNHPHTFTRAIVSDDDLLAAAILTPHPTGHWNAELAVHPTHRGQRLATRLTQTPIPADAPFDTTDIYAWAHGSHPAASQLAQRHGFAPVRELLTLSMNPEHRQPAQHLPQGVRVRTFRPGGDEAALLTANRAAFRDHPEQGALDATGLRERMREGWFDPHGLFVAHNDTGDILGFHWTKIHQHPPTANTPASRIGEIYVLGITPQARGLGLGKALAHIGLAYLRSQRVERIILYVEATNTAALALYRTLGFQLTDRHTLYAPR